MGRALIIINIIFKKPSTLYDKLITDINYPLFSALILLGSVDQKS
jgi:hypothetical protein